MSEPTKEPTEEGPRFDLAPAEPARLRGHYLPRDWVERALSAVHKPDDGMIHFFDLDREGRPCRAVCPVCKIRWEYRHGWENSR